MPPSIHPNFYKFLKPPTIEQIDAVVANAGVRQTQFERFHGMSLGVIAQVRVGERQMPVRFWHLFLEESRKAIPKRITNTPRISKEKHKRVVGAKKHKLSGLLA